MNPFKTPIDPAALDRQLRKGWRWLTFEPALEAEFRADYEQQQLPIRFVLIILGLILVGMMPLVDVLVLHPPQEFTRIVHPLQLGIMVPSILLALVCVKVKSLQQYSLWTGIMAILILVGGVILQRRLGEQVDHFVPAALGTLIIVGTCLMAGIRFWITLPVVVTCHIAITASELTIGLKGSELSHSLLVMGMETVVATCACYLKEHVERGNWIRQALLKDLTQRDELTHLYNARGFHPRYQQLCELAKRQQLPMLLAVIDLDHFGPYNDHFGHAAGDDCLRRVAEGLATRAERSRDVLAYLGNASFATVFYNIEERHAESMLDSLRNAVMGLDIVHPKSPSLHKRVTVSIGAYHFVPGDVSTPEIAWAWAERCLYAAKASGRNTFQLHRPDPAPSVSINSSVLSGGAGRFAATR